MTRLEKIQEAMEGELNGLNVPFIRAIGASDFSIQEVGNLISIPENLFYKILLRLQEPSFDIIARMSIILDISVEDLLSERQDG